MTAQYGQQAVGRRARSGREGRLAPGVRSSKLLDGRAAGPSPLRGLRTDLGLRGVNDLGLRIARITWASGAIGASKRASCCVSPAANVSSSRSSPAWPAAQARTLGGASSRARSPQRLHRSLAAVGPAASRRSLGSTPTTGCAAPPGVPPSVRRTTTTRRSGGRRMVGRVAIRGGEPSHHRAPEVVEFGLVGVPPTLQDAFKVRQCPTPLRPGPVPAGLLDVRAIVWT